MLRAECPRCHRVHWSDEAHDGRYLRCAGCGDAVRIGEQKCAQLEPLASQQEVPLRKGARVGRRHFFSGISFRKIWPKILVVSCIISVYLGITWRNGSKNFSHSVPSKAPVQLQAGEFEDAVPQSNPPPPPLERELASGPTQSSPWGGSPNKADIFSYTYFANGQEVIRGSKKRGRGRLTFVNGTSKDAVALLFRENTDVVARSVYVLAGQSANIDKLATGKYFVRVTLGQKWNNDDRSFAEGDEYFTFPHAYEFTEEKVGENIESVQVSLTLHTVPGGNIKKEPITRAQFLAIQPAVD
jgi:hypothetical protein